MLQQQEDIINFAINQGFPKMLSELIGAQAAHETGNFTSNAYQKDNNCFGYKAVNGDHDQIGNGITSTEGDPYAKYATIQDSTDDVLRWIKRRQREGKFPADLTTIMTIQQYAELLKQCGYYGAPVSEYIEGLTRFFSPV